MCGGEPDEELLLLELEFRAQIHAQSIEGTVEIFMCPPRTASNKAIGRLLEVNFGFVHHNHPDFGFDTIPLGFEPDRVRKSGPAIQKRR